MLKPRLRSLAIELLFWLSIALVIAPLVGLSFVQRRLVGLPGAMALADGWTVLDADGNTLASGVRLPLDFRHAGKLSSHRHWVLKSTIDPGLLSARTRPAVIIGQLHDADVVRLDGCIIGQTGLRHSKEQLGWWWGLPRLYEIPSRCQPSAAATSASLEIEIFKWDTPDSAGIWAAPIGIVNYEDALRDVKLVEWLRLNIVAVFGFVLIGIGLYYLFVFTLVPARHHNLVFAVCGLSIGVFEIITSGIPYHLSPSMLTVMRANLLSAFVTAWSFLWFLQVRLRSVSRLLVWAMGLSGVASMVISLWRTNGNDVYRVYEYWFVSFLVIFFVAYAEFIWRWVRNREKGIWRYAMGFSAVIFACAHDIFQTRAGWGHPWLVPYGFIVFFAAVALALAKEYADAFLHVEEQVGQRTVDLARALEQLRSLEKMKERFFANISHDFKTPIAIALGAIDEVKVKTLEPAKRNLNRLLDMITTMLDTVKAESGTLKITWQTTRVADFLKQCAEPFAAHCERKGLLLQVLTEGHENLKIPMDPGKIERVVENLLSNAVKFTDRRTEAERRNHPDGIIKIALKTDASRALIEVSDSGIGVPEAERAQIFDRYYQSTRTSLREHGGSGIGLSFAKEMVEIHNGEIWVEESEFGGSKFVIALPLSQDVEITGEFKIDEITGKEVIKGSLDVPYPPELPIKVSAMKPNVLVAEDNPEVAQITVNAISDHYNVYFASNGRRALEMLKAHRFDCVLTDIVMPIMRGDELVPEIRKDDALGPIPIVVLSSHGEDEMVISLLQKGANDYLTKPFRKEVLLSRLKAHIAFYRIVHTEAKRQKLQELGQLVGGIAHQGKNRVMRMQNHNGLALAALEAADALAKYDAPMAERLKKKINHLSTLVGRGFDDTQSLLTAIDRQSSGSENRQKIKIDEVIKDALELCSDKIKAEAITVECKGLEGLAFLGYNDYREAVLNILTNAVDAVPKAGEGKIEISGEKSAEGVSLTIADNGMGIDPSDLPRIFEPFYTSKPVGEGTGLGLFMARDAIELKNRGSLTVSSEGPGKGATFTLVVPHEAPEIKIQGPKVHDVEV